MIPLRFGLVGFGYWGPKLVRAFAATDRAQIVAVAERDLAVLGDLTSSITRCVNVESLCSDPTLDAIVIATPVATHAELAKLVLSSGKHCWVEKPLALSASAAQSLVTLASSVGKTLFVDETFLYDPLVRKIREWIISGRLGTIHHLSFERLGMGRIRRDSDVWWNSAPHDLSILRYLIDDELESIRVDRHAILQPGTADICIGTLRLRGGTSIHIYLSWLSPIKVASVVITGSLGMVRYEGRFDQRSLTRYEYRLDQPPPNSSIIPIRTFEPTETISGDGVEPLALAAQAFVASILDGTVAPSAGERSLRVVEWLERGGAAPSTPELQQS